ncbi:Arginyl-tRNA--protein transferase 1 [Tetrabaena socialis]|uniref:Arginyl-tRNA--protein transferase 1 n=1 Tax=Tetrabaena socialis TaxID=47790 RepID=A0A2J7ZSZ9_9CHLO|nr:Arginyl-tRNA--protein transferase 1 [Tetrabaena socialis]|eukprot:PNH03392.1 Arginyl-tRNA--protein transferase 1 [Tetrabaena socialis]
MHRFFPGSRAGLLASSPRPSAVAQPISSSYTSYRLAMTYCKLVAVGVVDVLPRCLSSVYFFWDTQLAALAPGRFSALQEVQWVRQRLPACPALRFYYMGFYIHSCPKMRYKAEYRPSDLLCPVRKVWVRVSPELLAALGRQPFLPLSGLPGARLQPNMAAPPAAAARREEGPEAAAGAAVLARFRLLPEEAMAELREALRAWRAVVGWAAPALVYQL